MNKAGLIIIPNHINVTYDRMKYFMEILEKELINNFAGMANNHKDIILFFSTFLSPLLLFIEMKIFVTLMIFLSIISLNSYFGVLSVLNNIYVQCYSFNEYLQSSEPHILCFRNKFIMFMNRYYIFEKKLLNFYFKIAIYEFIIAYLFSYIIYSIFTYESYYVFIVLIISLITINFYDKRFKSNEFKMVNDNFNILNIEIKTFFK